MAKKLYMATALLSIMTAPGKLGDKSKGTLAVPPETKDIPAGHAVEEKDFSEADWARFIADGSIIESDRGFQTLLNQTGVAPAFVPAGTDPEDYRKRRVREAQFMGVEGVDKDSTLEDIESAIEKHMEKGNVRNDGTQASIQQGAGRANPQGDGTGSGGDAAGTARGAAPTETAAQKKEREKAEKAARDAAEKEAAKAGGSGSNGAEDLTG